MATDASPAVGPVSAPTARPGLALRLTRYPALVKGGSVIVCLGLWELLGRGVDPLLLSYPSAIARAVPPLIASGQLLAQAVESLRSFAAGFALAIGVGVPVGLCMGRYRLVEYALDWHVHAWYATPRVAMIPLLVLWFGLGLTVKIAIVFLTAVFPIILTTYSGAKNVSPQLTETAQAYGARPRDLFLKVLLPATLPYIIAGLRLGIGRAIIGMTLAELFTAVSGLGYLLISYANSLATDKLFVPIVLLAGLGMGLTELLGWVQRRVAPWKETERLHE